MDGIYKEKPRIANIGIRFFYDALVAQNCECTQIEWMPPMVTSAEVEGLLDDLL